MIFTADHIRALATWSEQLGLTSAQAALFALYHKMTVTKAVTDEEITCTAMNAIHIIRDAEQGN